MKTICHRLAAALTAALAIVACGGGETSAPDNSVIAPSVSHLSQSDQPFSSVPNEQEPSATQSSESTVQPRVYLSQWKATLESSITARNLPVDVVPALDALDAEGKAVFDMCPITNGSTSTMSCSVGAKNAKYRAVITGDSYAMMLWPTFTNAFDLRYWNVTLLAQGGCPFSSMSPLEIQKFNRNCNQHRAFVFQRISAMKPNLVIISENAYGYAGSNGYARALQTSLAELAPLAETSILVQAVRGHSLDSCLSEAGNIDSCRAAESVTSNVDQMQREIAQSLNVRIMRLASYLCIRGECPAVIGKVVVSSDGYHLTRRMAQEIAPLVAMNLRSLGIPKVVFQVSGDSR